MYICLSHSHSLGTNLRHFASSLNLQKKNKLFKRCLANSLAVGSYTHYPYVEGISHIFDLPKVYQDILTSFCTMADMQCSWLARIAMVIAAL